MAAVKVVQRPVQGWFTLGNPFPFPYAARVNLRQIAARAAFSVLAAVLFAAPGCATRKAASARAANETAAAYARTLAHLIDPSSLATLRTPRAANPRVQKAVYWLSHAASNSVPQEVVVNLAVELVGMEGKAAKLTKAALLRNLDIASKLGCLDEEGLAEMRRGKSATVRRGPYAGDQLSVDHIIPRSVCPELDNVIANLELMPQRLNSRKRAAIGERQLDLARRLHAAGLLSAEGKELIAAYARR